MKTLLLIDGNSLLYRAFFALPLSMRTRSGQTTNAIYGFTSMILKLMDDLAPESAAVAFDTKEKTFRHDMFKEYKANREAPPDDLISQFLPARKIMEALKIPVLEAPGFEADDIIGALAKEGESDGYSVKIVTADKDAYQLVTDNVSILTTKTGITDLVTYGPAQVIERYGVTPLQIIDFLALKGDSSDNVPGVPGIGDKTAAKLIQEFGGIEDIYSKIDDVKPERIKNILIDNKERAFMSRDLVILKTDIDLKYSVDDLDIHLPDIEDIREIFTEYEFQTLLKRHFKDAGLKSDAKQAPLNASAQISLFDALDGQDGGQAPIMSGVIKPVEPLLGGMQITYLNGDAELGELKRSLKSGQNLSIWIDSERRGCCSDIKCLIVAIEGEETRFAYGAIKPTRDTFVQVIAVIADIAEGRTIITNNAKHLYAAFFEAGHFNVNLSGDPEIAAYCLDPAASNSYDKLCFRYLGLDLPDENDDKNERVNDHLNVDEDGDNGEDGAEVSMAFYLQRVSVLRPLISALHEQVEKENLTVILDSIEMPLVKVLALLEFRGMALDEEVLDRNGREIAAALAGLEKGICADSGETFNLNSPKQLAEVIYAKMGLSTSKKTKTGFSTDSSTLQKISSEHPIIGKILDYREMYKLKSTYFDVLGEQVDPSTKRIHTTFNQTLAATGRLSSSSPNLQNIPIRSELGKKIREAFVPGAGFERLISADYSQIELRLMAHFSGDDNFINAFKSGLDVHTATAAEIFGRSLEDVTASDRRIAKAVNFGIIYGISAFGLSNQLSISREDAQTYIDLYFSRYPTVMGYIEETVASALELGYSATLFGRKRYIPELRSRNVQEKNLGRRLAVNSVLQGTAADIIKIAMIRCESALAGRDTAARLILSVHDELIFEVTNVVCESVMAEMKEIMQGIVTLKVPLDVNILSAANWAELK